MFLQIQNDTSAFNINPVVGYESLQIWLWIALLEFIIIIVLLLKLRNKKGDLTFGELPDNKIREIKKLDVDMKNLMNSINSSKKLYKELSRACHPDRFVNSEKQEIAEEIFQEISKNKRDYKKLIELKQRMINELKIQLK